MINILMLISQLKEHPFPSFNICHVKGNMADENAATHPERQRARLLARKQLG